MVIAYSIARKASNARFTVRMLFAGRPASCGVTLTQPWVTDEQEQGCPQSAVLGVGKPTPTRA